MATDYIENRLFEQLNIGDVAVLERELSERDIRVFAVLTGDFNPLHVDREFAADRRFHRVIAHGMWGAALISALIGTKLPGPGTILASQSLEFKKPIFAGDKIRVEVRVAEKFVDGGRVRLACRCLKQDGEAAIEGELEVLAPSQHYVRERGKEPSLYLALKPDRFAALIEQARAAGAKRAGVVYPVDEPSLKGALDARDSGLIIPVLIGPRDKIENAAAEAGLDLGDAAIVEAPSPEEAAGRAVELARDGQIALLMKGALHTDELMGPIVSEPALRAGRRLSHIFAMDVPGYDRLLFISDGAINIRPSLKEMRDIVQNAIDLARALGNEDPKVALLSAVENVTEAVESTMTAAALCKMAERGEITGGTLDGPLAMDNAISEQAARIKGIESPVAGKADILIVPDLVSGNILAKDLDYLAGADGAGVVVGAKVPVALTSRADTPAERVASAALACLVAGA